MSGSDDEIKINFFSNESGKSGDILLQLKFRFKLIFK